jgi:hypothetical protein
VPWAGAAVKVANLVRHKWSDAVTMGPRPLGIDRLASAAATQGRDAGLFHLSVAQL